VSAGGFNDRRRGRRSGHGGGDDGHADERWLLTYADMITLLMALFIVLYSMSVVNTSKFEALSESLNDALSGKVLPHSDSVMEGSKSSVQGVQTSTPSSPADASFQIIPRELTESPAKQAESAAKEEDSLRRVQRQIEEYAREHGLSDKLRTTINERGLDIRLLTDGVLFESGSGTLRAEALPLVDKVADLVRNTGFPNPIRIEGNTDSMPISTAEFRSNWELSTARATAVLQEFIASDVPESRLSVAGYADQHPAAPNDSPAGRAANRRVDVVVLRTRSSQGATP
jgi:chemotaxis protein MotB